MPITGKVVWDGCHEAAERAGIQKRIYSLSNPREPRILDLCTEFWIIY
jgi:hypothetical protein